MRLPNISPFFKPYNFGKVFSGLSSAAVSGSAFFSSLALALDFAFGLAAAADGFAGAVFAFASLVFGAFLSTGGFLSFDFAGSFLVLGSLGSLAFLEGAFFSS